MMLPLTRHGLREMVAGSVVLAILAVLFAWLWLPLVILILPVWIWLFAFFRDPERVTPSEENVLVSPADGTVSDITDIPQSDLLGGPAIRVGIFLSVFNVHVNRSPCAGKVISSEYRPGKFFNALSHAKASEHNECNTLVLGDAATGRPIAVVKQIVGAIARRIVCTARPGDVLERGQRIGMMKFGSRTELFIPKWMEPQIKVNIGQKVRGAIDVIATVRNPATATV